MQLQFQSTLPARGATSKLLQVQKEGAISIHAPRTGSDPLVLRRGVPSYIAFQSTLPARGATVTSV